MKKLRFNAVHTRKKHDQCESCTYYIQAPYVTGGGKYIFEFCTSKGHKGVIIQYKERTERTCFDYRNRDKSHADMDRQAQNNGIKVSG
ncbi:MAG: hypothetical protein K6T66_03975 [Peptococcaceae bacterium]|nr:hypothetical protein [Peptococcaceae bacterium]